MLEGGASKVGKNKGANKTFKEFRGGAKQRDGAERRGKVRGFTRFEDWEDEGLFPEGREVSRAKGKVEKFRKEGNAKGTKVFEMKVGEGIRA